MGRMRQATNNKGPQQGRLVLRLSLGVLRLGSLRELRLAFKTQGKAKVSGTERDQLTSLCISMHSTFKKNLLRLYLR